MAEERSERDIRLDHLRSYEAQFGSAYPAKSHRTQIIQQVLADFAQLQNQTIIIAGRIRSFRTHGKLIFVDIEDATGKMQVVFSMHELSEEQWKNTAYYNIGDIIEVTGQPFITKTGQQSLLIKDFHLLSKSLQPFPDKWHGIQDEELRYRKRYLDILLRPELRDMFVKKSRFWYAIRHFLVEEGFLEIETPVLEATPGGADAEPFMTHHNALDIDLYLRISVGELWQKRLMVAGFEKTFELGRVFRNEGISPEHLQDYTAMEFYWAYADYTASMELVERMYKHCIQETFGTLQFTIRNYNINLDQAWERIDYVTIIKEKLQIDILEASLEELRAKCEVLGIQVTKAPSRGRLMDSLWKYCRKDIAGPVFLMNHPVEVSPLAKRKTDDPRLVERYQVIIAGSELGNGYSELNDPLDQQQRFEEQAKLRAAGDVEAQMHDEEFVEALEYGMPPTSGFGVSERLFSFLMNKPIRECVLFPLLRPKQDVQESTTTMSNDPSLQVIDSGITRQAALQLMEQHVKDSNLRKHMYATEALMKKLAEHFKSATPEAWGIAGLVHDIDWEQTEPENHSLVGAELLAKSGVNELIVNAVREHNHMHGIEPQTLLSKSLQCLEQLTGLIMAATLVRPDKSLANVQVSSVKKKFKDKSFAKGVSRENILRSNELLGLTLEESIQLCIEAMQTIAKELELA